VKSERNYAYYALVLFIPVGLVWLFSQSCLESEAAGQLCLSWMEPLIQPLRRVLNALGDHPKFLYNKQMPYYCGFVAAVALLALVRKQLRPGIFWALAIFPILGEWSSLVAEKNNAIIYYLSGLFLIALFWFFSRRIDDYEDTVPPLRYSEVVIFLPLIGALLCWRFYALNRLPAGWDTELCIFRSFASSFDRLWQHESGWAPQTSTGLSWLLINRLLGHFDEPELYYLYHRMVGCLLSVLKVAVLFLFLRMHFGRFAAFFGASILAFGPPEDWWARVPNFHHWPGLLTVLIIWATINAMQKKTWGSFIFLSLLSVTTRWVYPSGMFMVCVPLCFFGSLLVFQWSQWRPYVWRISSLMIGLAIWIEWLSVCRALYRGQWETLPPLYIPSHSEMPLGLLAKLYQIFVLHVGDLFTNLFLKQVSSTHWTVLMTPAPWKAMPSIVGILVLLAMARMIGQRRDKLTWLFVICLFFGALPGITSSVADRRIGAMFVVLIIIAAREAAWIAHFMQRTTGRSFVRTLQVLSPLVLGAYLATLSGAFFFFTTQGIPRQNAVGKIFQQHVRDNYLLVDLTGQLKCDLFQSLQRQLVASECRSAFVSSRYDGEFMPSKLIENPRFDKSEWWYSEKGLTKLSACEDWPTRKWEGATFVITESPHSESYTTQLQQRFPEGVLERVTISYLPYQSEEVLIFTTKL
jgi:hypothetical protein